MNLIRHFHRDEELPWPSPSAEAEYMSTGARVFAQFTNIILALGVWWIFAALRKVDYSKVFLFVL